MQPLFFPVLVVLILCYEMYDSWLSTFFLLHQRNKVKTLYNEDEVCMLLLHGHGWFCLYLFPLLDFSADKFKSSNGWVRWYIIAIVKKTRLPSYLINAAHIIKYHYFSSFRSNIPCPVAFLWSSAISLSMKSLSQDTQWYDCFICSVED